MNKKITFTILGGVIILGLILVLSNSLMNTFRNREGCDFVTVDSTEYKINSVEDIVNALSANGWSLTTNFDKSEIEEVNTANEGWPSDFITDKNIRYWQVSAFKKFGKDVRRIDLIDENGRLYRFRNCV